MAAFVWGDGGTQMTPEQIAAQRKIAAAMMEKGMDYSPVQAWSQGASRVAQSMLGGFESRQADESDKANAEANKQMIAALLGGAAGVAPVAPVAAASPQAAAPVAASPVAAAPAGNVAPGKIYSENEPSPLDPPSGVDRDRAIRTVLAEAGNQGPTGMNAVASVIRNRAVNGGYGGNTPSGVVTAPSQFEPWNTEAGRSKMAAIDPNGPSYRAAGTSLDAAYAGNDPTNGAVNFIQPKLQADLGRPMPAWAQGPGTMIGDHKFIGGKPVDPAAPPYQVAGPAVAAPTEPDPVAPGLEKVAQAMTPTASPISGINPAVVQAMTSRYSDAGTKAIASAIFQSQLKGETTDEIKEYNLAKKQGFAGSFFDFKSGLKKAGATNVSVDTKGENSFATEAGKVQAKRFDELAGEGQKARQMVSDIDTLTELGKNIETGKTAEAKAKIGPYAEALGIKVDKLSDIQAYEAIVNRVAPSLRVPGSGAQSDYELKNFVKSLPSLGNTPDGNAMAAATLKGLQENKVLAAEIASKALNGEITRPEAEKQLRNLPDPMTNYREFMKNRKPAETKATTVDPAALEEAKRRGLIK